MARSDSTCTPLAKRTLIRLSSDAREVRCESGSVWITVDGDRRDILLEPGQRFRREGSAGVIVYALTAACLTVQHDDPAPSRASRSLWPPARTPANS